jgi:hypothetical protein
MPAYLKQDSLYVGMLNCGGRKAPKMKGIMPTTSKRRNL